MRLKIIFVCLLFAIKINAQTELPEVGKIVQVPNSPEASAFVKYGNTQVSLYTGVPNIAVPIYTIKGRELQMPISLTYDASGIKVKQLATNVGLGWNLNVGGVITRSVAGLPDDRITAFPQYKSHHDPSVQSIIDKYPDGMYEMDLYDDGDVSDFKFFIEQKMNESKVDILPDLYNFSVNGLSDTFYIDYELNIGKCLNNSNLKVYPIFGIPPDGDTYTYNKYLIGFTITDERGSIYEFNKYEITDKTQGFDGRDKRVTFNSAWYLTKIISATKKDILEFTYSDSFTWVNNESYYNDYSSLKNSTGSGGIDESSYLIEVLDFESDCSGINLGAMNTFVRYKISQFNLTNIRLNNKEIVSFETTANNRLDITGGKKALEYVKIKDLNGNIINEVQLHTSYFETASHPTNQEQYYRLKLDAVSFNSSTDKKYEFKYNGEGNIPSRQSKGQDYWGYYNGKDTNGSLVPKSKLDYISGADLGGDREVDATAIMGTLSEITYPTGGHTAFQYRLNNVEEIKQVENSFEELIVEVTNQNNGFDPNEPFNFLNCSNSIECPGVGNGHTLPEPYGNENSFLIEESGEYRFQLNTIFNGTNADCNYSFFAVFPDTGVQTQYCDVLNNPNAMILKTISAADESSLIYTVNLEPGTYKALIFNSIQNATVSVSINRTFTTPITVKRDIGGLRVQKIIDYTTFSEIATTKHYYYDDIRELNSSNITPNISYIDDSSAIIHEKAIFSEITNYRGFHLQNELEKHTSCNFDTRYAFNIATAQKNHIAYSKVSEIVFNENDEFQGYKVYDFYNIDYNNDDTFLPYNVEYGNDNNGKLKETTTYNDLGNILTKVESFYNVPEIIDESKTMLSFRSTISAYRELYTAKINVSGVTKQLYIWQEPGNCGNSTTCTDLPNGGSPYYDILSLYGGDQTPIYKSKRFGLIRYWNYLEQKKQTNYFYNSSNILINTVEQKTNYFYDNIDHKQLTKTETTTNQNETLITEIDYAHDLLGSQPLMQNLIDANRISEPVQTKSFLNNLSNVISHQLTKYTLTSDNLLLPETIQTSTGAEVLEDRIVYHKYDDKGNPLEVSKKDGQSISYIWGYHKSQPIAKIINATFSDISSYISSLQNLANLDDDRTVDVINGSNITYQGNEGNLREALQNLRTTLPNAMITTFTYDPLIGVTSIVDPKGQIQYFYYDNYNRLEYVKDKHGHILSKNEYNFRPQN